MQIPVVEAYLGLTSSLPCYSQIQMVAAGEASGVEVKCRTIRTFVLALMQEPIVVHPQSPFSCATSPSISLSLPPT
jgi:hypothetical protein